MADASSSLRWSAGSILFLASWAALMGPYAYATHLISGSRLPFTAVYFGSIIMTIYFAAGVSSCTLSTSRYAQPHANPNNSSTQPS